MVLAQPSDILQYLPIKFGKIKITLFLLALIMSVLVVWKLNDMAWAVVLIVISLWYTTKHALFSGLTWRQWFKKFWRLNVKGYTLWIYRLRSGKLVYEVSYEFDSPVECKEADRYISIVLNGSRSVNRAMLVGFLDGGSAIGPWNIVLSRDIYAWEEIWLELRDIGGLTYVLPAKLVFKMMEIILASGISNLSVTLTFADALGKLLPAQEISGILGDGEEDKPDEKPDESPAVGKDDESATLSQEPPAPQQPGPPADPAGQDNSVAASNS